MKAKTFTALPPVKVSHLAQGARNLKEQAMIGDRFRLDLDIGEEEPLKVTAILREKYPHVCYMEYRGRKNKWRPLSIEAKLSKEQQEIVRLIGKFYAFYGLEEPNTEALYHGAWTLVQGRRKRNV